MDNNPKQFVKSKSSEDSSLITDTNELEKGDDDPLSIRNSSITFIGILLAVMTIFLPSISVLIGRPLSQGNEIIKNYLIKQDGS